MTPATPHTILNNNSVSDLMNENSDISHLLEQVQAPTHSMVTRAKHDIHKPNPRYALMLECNAIPNEP